jgi:hypothetical protein
MMKGVVTGAEKDTEKGMGKGTVKETGIALIWKGRPKYST